MILLCRHPGADVRRTVAKHNATTGFVVAQVANGVSIGDYQIREVQHHEGAGRFSVDQVPQLAHVLNVQSTADREHEGLVHPAMNLQQRHDGARDAITGPVESGRIPRVMHSSARPDYASPPARRYSRRSPFRVQPAG